jgi:hypothetical protein
MKKTMRKPQIGCAHEQSPARRMATFSQLLPPSVKLIGEERIGPKTIKKHDTPKALSKNHGL